MSEHRLPKTIDSRRLAEHGEQLTGQLVLADMARLLVHLVGDDGVADVSLVGRVDEEGRAVVSGQVKAVVKLRCQRCMQAYDETLASDFCLVAVKDDDEAKELPDRYDGLVVEHHEIDMLTMIEDELLLALPLVARHEEQACSAKLSLTERTVTSNQRQNPFAVLAKLKRKK